MKKVRLFVNGDMTVIDIGTDTYKNFHSYDREEVIANVVRIDKKGSSYLVHTDFRNPRQIYPSSFYLCEENFQKVKWVE